MTRAAGLPRKITVLVADCFRAQPSKARMAACRLSRSWAALAWARASSMTAWGALGGLILGAQVPGASLEKSGGGARRSGVGGACRGAAGWDGIGRDVAGGTACA